VRNNDSVSESAAHSDWMYVDPFYGGQVLHHDEVCHRIAAATGLAAQASTSIRPLISMCMAWQKNVQ